MIRKTLLAAAIAALSLQAQADTVVVQFHSDAFDGGSLLDQTLSGQFSFDDATLTATTAWLPLTSLSFTLGGQTYAYGAAALTNADASFSGGQLLGLNAVINGAGAHDVLFSDGFGAPYVFYMHPTNAADYGFASLTFTAAVPEPESYALMLGGLGLVGWMARRRKA